MIWLSWRQARTQVLAVYAFTLVAAVVLLATGRHLAHLASTTTDVYDLLSVADRRLFQAGIYVLALAPAVIGAFWGAPLVARELETSTHRLVWTQSVTRTRWLAVRLGAAVLAAAVAVGVLTLAVTWWAGPLDGATGNARGSLPSRLTPVSFAMRGIVPVGYAVFAVVLGVLVGLLVRRTVPAMAVTLAVYVAVQLLVPAFVRPHLIPPRTASIAISESTLDGIMQTNDGPLRITVHTSEGDWILSDITVDAAGHARNLPSWFAECMPAPPPPGSATQRAPAGDLDACLARLRAEGYHQRVVYQPKSRFWPLQWAETGLYLAASGVLAAGCFWWTRRRLS